MTTTTLKEAFAAKYMQILSMFEEANGCPAT